MNGLELMAKIKNYNADIHCIAVSGQTNWMWSLRPYRQGAVDYIIKNDNAIVNLRIPSATREDRRPSSGE